MAIPQTQTSAKILVVEDSTLSFRFIKNSLEEIGLSISHAESGFEAIEALKTLKPDLILLDMVMDGMDGIETCEKIKSDPATRDIPVIFLTATEGQESLVRAFEVGAVDYVVKKFNPTEMVARVQTQIQLLQSKRDLLDAKNRAELLSNQKSEFLSVVAHDLKNPLAGISGFADILQDQYRNPQEGVDVDPAELIDGIIASADHMLSILSDLLVSQTLSGLEMNLERQTVDLVLVVREVVLLNRIKARKKGIELTYEAPEPCRVSVDLIRMREIIDNLVNNAVKYTPQGKKVFVRIGPSPESARFIRFEVTDEGPGLSDEDKKKLFGRFQKLSAKPTGDEISTGLGLSIAKTYVEMLNGKIWAESELGKGASFFFEVDRVQLSS